jgi:HAD superfamily hydrolase (TIGR01509 family)
VSETCYSVFVPLDALIFDFDGLILDTETPEVLVWRELYREYGQVYSEEQWNHAIGRGAEEVKEGPLEVLDQLVGGGLDLEEVDSIRKKRLMNMIYAEQPRRGVTPLLKEAKSLGIRLGVASSSKHWWVDGHLQRLGLFQYFDHIVCADDVLRAKPYPDLYLKAASLLKVGLDEAIAFEDSPNGIASAVGAGIFVIAVPNSQTSSLDLSAANVRFDSLDGIHVDRLAELLHY